MIDHLKAVIAEAEQLSAEEQEALARAWEIALDELGWQRSLNKPGAIETLQRLADEAEAEHEAGLSEEIVGDTWL